MTSMNVDEAQDLLPSQLSFFMCVAPSLTAHCVGADPAQAIEKGRKKYFEIFTCKFMIFINLSERIGEIATCEC